MARTEGMGLGTLMNPNVFFKRKYRWTFSLNTPCGKVSENIVKVAARPQLNIEELEINYLQGKMWIPGRASWETLTVTYYDVSAQSEDASTLYCWLKTVHEFHDPNKLRQSSVPGSGVQAGANPGGGWAASAVLSLYDGTGQTAETWKLGMIFPTSIQWGDLDYSSNDEATIELTLRYSTATYEPGDCMSSVPSGTPFTCKGAAS